MPQPDFVPLQMNPLGAQLDLNAPVSARLPNLALPALVGMGVQAGARALADFGAGISGSPTLGEQNIAARGTAAELAGLGMGVPAPPGSLSAFLGYHGTPHLFEPEPGAPFGAFRNEAIGSGEGAQAYGWGHYVAGNPSIAEDYRKNLSGNSQVTTIDKIPAFDHPDVTAENPHIQMAVNELNAADGNPNRAIAAMQAHIKGQKTYGYSLGPTELNNLNKGIEWIKTNRDRIGWYQPGHLLEVHILPEESDLLDWDKPLSEQPTGVQEALKPISSSLPDQGQGWTGQMIYQNLVRQYGDKLAANLGGTTARELGPRAASQALDSAGIPGLRYLDAGSRAAGEGTHNYVLFHPRHLRIIGRNGERLEPIEGDPFAGAGGQ